MTVAIIGATASGKSDLAMAVASAVDGVEIVAVDAMQIYRGMDIGTAKPSPADRAAVVHHALDLVEPFESFTVAEFQKVALSPVDDITARHGRALLVAGTGLYLASVVDRLEIPGAWPALRADLEETATTAAGLAQLYAELQELDPLAASRMEPANARRVVRALEVCRGSGRPFSSFGPGLETYPPTDVVQIGLRWPRAVLAPRIETRVERMMASGLLAEVRRLVDSPVPMSRTARQALGYKELIDHLEGTTTLDEAVATIVTRTRQFAARQDRWFRRDPRIRWIDIETDSREALPVVLEAVGR